MLSKQQNKIFSQLTSDLQNNFQLKTLMTQTFLLLYKCISVFKMKWQHELVLIYHSCSREVYPPHTQHSLCQVSFLNTINLSMQTVKLDNLVISCYLYEVKYMCRILFRQSSWYINKRLITKTEICNAFLLSC